MITLEELKNIARFNHFKIHQQEKHYIQTIVINSIYSSINRELVFKGGTSLMFFYNLNRFSEDLDFTLIGEIDINKLISNIKRDLENFGISNKIIGLKEDERSISFKIGAQGPLFNKEIERCFVSIDISKREKVEKFEVLEFRSQYKDILGFSVVIMDKKELFAEKVRALITRNQARDLYDTYFLLKQGVKIDINLIDAKLNYYNKKFDIFEFEKSVKNKKEIWTQELNPLIIGNLPEFREVLDFVIKEFRIKVKDKSLSLK